MISPFTDFHENTEKITKIPESTQNTAFRYLGDRIFLVFWEYFGGYDIPGLFPVLLFLGFFFYQGKPQNYQGFSVPVKPTKSLEKTRAWDIFLVSLLKIPGPAFSGLSSRSGHA